MEDKIRKRFYFAYNPYPVLESGYIYAPYIPINVVEEFTPRPEIASRYSETRIDPIYYGTINVNNIDEESGN